MARDVIFFEDEFDNRKENNEIKNEVPIIFTTNNFREETPQEEKSDEEDFRGFEDNTSGIEDNFRETEESRELEEDVRENEEKEEDVRCRRYPARERKKPDRFCDSEYCALLLSKTEPRTIKDVMQRSDKNKWIEAMKSEYG